MSIDRHDERPGHAALGSALMAAGVLTSDWAPTFAAVPRSAFLPDLIWPFDMAAGRSVAVCKADDPAAWRGYADAADVPIVTQWDDGRHSGTEPGAVPTSSASMPSVVFRMLDELDLRAGHKVLEIGTATGWNAALMAHRAGPGNVVTVEVDGTVAAAARAAAERYEIGVQVVHGDGALGRPEGAPYDRVIATCGVRAVPYAWVAQTRPGGVVVVPWGTHFGNGDAVARLVVAADGKSAAGRFTGPVEFMKLRAQRAPVVDHSVYVTGSVDEGEESATTLTEEEVLGGQFGPQRFVWGLRVPDCCHVVAEKRDGGRPVWFYGLGGDRSWACVWFRDGAAARVWQSGPRRLWDEVAAAHRWWVAHGRPDHTRFGLTVDANGQRVWLDNEGTEAGPEGAWAV